MGKFRYGSVCSGIEAATAAWHHLGWEPAFFSEIEAFPRAVLAHHYPEVPLHGDFTTIGENQYGSIQLLVGGTPCQSFSVAGLRGGLDDDRGNLALEFLKLAQRERPRWVVWENVPGVLSSNGGRDFGAILGGLVELGYGFAYRVLDAQYFGVAQRRRRVFVVGYLGDWRAAAAVLFERQSLCGHPAPSREARKGLAADVTHSPRGRGFDASEDGTGRGTPIVPEVVGCMPHQAHGGVDTQSAASGYVIPQVAGALDTECGGGKLTHQSINNGHLVPETMGTITARMFNALGSRDVEEGAVVPVAAFDVYNQEDTGDVSKPVAARSDQDTASCVAFMENQRGEIRTDVVTDSLKGRGGKPGQRYQAVVEPMTLAIRGRGDGRNLEARTDGTANALMTPNGGRDGIGVGAIANGMSVRRLTPVECERLQGFPDNYTRIPWRNKPAENCPDGPRYKALGNSMAVPVMRWIGERIQQVDQHLAEAKGIEIVAEMNAGPHVKSTPEHLGDTA